MSWVDIKGEFHKKNPKSLRGVNFAAAGVNSDWLLARLTYLIQQPRVNKELVDVVFEYVRRSENTPR